LIVYIQGSGKTYTIGGGNISPVTEDEDGIIPRAVRQMFDTLSVSIIPSHTKYPRLTCPDSIWAKPCIIFRDIFKACKSVKSEQGLL
jgi:hypothetical protein